MIRFHAHFDGKNLCPDEPVSLPEGVRLSVTVDEAPAETASDVDSEWDEFDSLLRSSGVKTGISDLAHQHDHYLHGTPKHPG